MLSANFINSGQKCKLRPDYCGNFLPSLVRGTLPVRYFLYPDILPLPYDIVTTSTQPQLN